MTTTSTSEGGVAGHSLVYIIGSTISVIGGIVMLPIYTHALTSADYGLLDTVLRFVAMCMSVVFMGIRQAYQRLYFDKRTASQDNALTATVILANFGVTIAVLLPILILASLTSRHFGISQFTVLRSVALAVWITFEATYLVGLSYLQVRLRSREFVIAQSGRLLLVICVNFTLLRVLHLGLQGAILGNILASVASGLFTAVVLLRSAGIKVSTAVLKELLSFGLPYIPTVVFFYIIGNADRLMLIHIGDVTSLGLLALAGKIGELALMVCAGPVDNVWAPHALSVFRNEDGANKIGALYTKFVAMFVLLVLGVSLAAPIGVALLAHGEYEFAARLVPIVAVGWLFNVLTTLSDIGIIISKRTWMKPLGSGIASIVAISLQYVITPRFGVVGATVSTVLTYITFFLIIRGISQRFFPVATRPRDFLVIAVSASLLLFVGLNVIYAYRSLWVSLAASVFAVSIYGAVLIGTGTVASSDLKSIVANLGIPKRFFS